MKKMALSEPSVSWLAYSLSAEKFSTIDACQTLMTALQWNVSKCVDVCVVGQYQTTRHIFVYGLQTFRSSGGIHHGFRTIKELLRFAYNVYVIQAMNVDRHLKIDICLSYEL